jgi:methyl-accepting chemotaxis protein
MSPTTHRRRLKNYLIDPNFQLRYVLYVSLSGISALAVLYGFLAIRLTALMEMNFKPEVTSNYQLTIADLINQIAAISVAAFLITLFMSFVVGIVVSHRISGPARKIEAALLEMAQGNYSKTLELRKSDDLQGIKNAVNVLAQALRKG